MIQKLLPFNARKNRMRAFLYLGVAAGSFAVGDALTEIASLALRATNLSTSLADYGLLGYGVIGLVMLALLAVLRCIDRLMTQGPEHVIPNRQRQ